MTGSDAPRHRDAETTRARMVEAAVDIAARKGQRAVTYRAVSEASGVAHSLIRHHFGTRDALLREAFESTAERDIAELTSSEVSMDFFLDTTLGALERESIEGDHRRLLVFDSILRALREGEDRERIVELYDLSVDRAGTALSSVGVPDDDGTLARLIIAVIDGLTLQHPLYASYERSEGIIRRLRGLLMMIAAEQSGGREPLPGSAGA